MIAIIRCKNQEIVTQKFSYFKINQLPFIFLRVIIKKEIINLKLIKIILKYLTPEIEALSKQFEVTKSLARTNISCGIFQDCDYDEERPKLHQKQIKV